MVESMIGLDFGWLVYGGKRKANGGADRFLEWPHPSIGWIFIDDPVRDQVSFNDETRCSN